VLLGDETIAFKAMRVMKSSGTRSSRLNIVASRLLGTVTTGEQLVTCACFSPADTVSAFKLSGCRTRHQWFEGQRGLATAFY